MTGLTGIPGEGATFSARRYNGEAAAAPAQPAPLILTRPADLAGRPVPERPWIVPNWLPSGVVTGLYGKGGVGKSLLAKQLQTSTALGRPWAGHYTEKCASLGLYCEDSIDELHRRQYDINLHYQVGFADLCDMHWLPRLGNDNLLMVFNARGVGELTPFHRQIVEAARDLTARLLIVDTASDTFAGNENDRSQVRQYVSVALGSIAQAINGAVLVCCHPSRSGIATGEGDGGSTAWSNAFRSRLFLTTPEVEEGEAPDPDARLLLRKKANYAARDDAIKLRWRSGAFATDEALPGFGSSFGRRPVEEVFMDIFSACETEGQHVSESRNAGNYAPALFAQRPDREGYRKPDFARAMQTLFAGGRLRVVEYGPPSKMRRRIERIA